jgi:hypothetical protein
VIRKRRLFRTIIVFGLIWQAEEALVDGQWRRYYGFVGNHISKVPPEDIEILEYFSALHPRQ